MTVRHQLLAAALSACALLLPGCAPPPGYYGPTTYGPSVQYGVVESIDVVQTGGAPPSGAGAVVGGIAGGVLGHQIGSGSGNTAATIAGAIGGALVGNQVERNANAPVAQYRIRVRTDSGSGIELINPNDLNLRVGDRVRIEGNRVFRM